MTRPVIAVIDYGIGNLHSAQKSLEVCGADARLTADPDVIASADGVVLPGVGAFGACMDALRSTGVEQPTLDAVGSGRPFLGICVGMQMLFTSSEENAESRGLDVIPGVVRWIPRTAGIKIPQMQWNRLDLVADDDGAIDPMLVGLGDEPWLYFVHSLHGVPDDASMVAATVDYGITVNAAFRRGNVFAAQFHPEKSSKPGLALLTNFVRECAA
ncbi:MAG: imidazole glycerol phosphate synthase subunit HisH [Ilumatobacter sp.]|uniref:imidazole glycerol phosphate synthase subunit HisH n=1 Tax=Ilumatobacter sp. TaxID=1967498 RepID=UPI003298064B